MQDAGPKFNLSDMRSYVFMHEYLFFPLHPNNLLFIRHACFFIYKKVRIRALIYKKWSISPQEQEIYFFLFLYIHSKENARG